MTRKFGVALRAIPLISCLTVSNALAVQKVTRATTVNPSTWINMGCYVDVGRTLSQGGYNDNNAMTVESCITYCASIGYVYAGTEYTSQCCKMITQPGAF
jgi:hypothetical protein